MTVTGVMEVVDVYETSDLPEVDQAMVQGDENTDSVDTLNISASEAFGRFKGAYIDSSSVDFSDKLRNTRRKGYNVVWSGESKTDHQETPVKKYQRLNCEVRELLEDITSAKENKDSALEDHTLETIGGQVEMLHKHLLEMRLEDVLGEQTVSTMTDPQAAGRMRLLAQLDELKAGGESKQPRKVAGSGGQECNTPSYSLYIKPAATGVTEGALLGELQSRISMLERRVGLQKEHGDMMATLTMETGKKNIMQAVQVLSAKTTLLDPNNLANIEGRLGALQQKLGQLQEDNSSLDSESMSKLEGLLSVVERSQPMYTTLPTVIQRLETLQSLHEKAADMSRGLVELETVQQQLAVQLGNNQGLLKTTQKRFSGNLETIHANFASLVERVERLKQK